MKRSRFVLMTSFAIAFIASAHAQNTQITDSHEWLQQYQQQHGSPPKPEDVDVDQQAIYDRIAAVQDAANQTIVATHHRHWQSVGGPSSGPNVFTLQMQHNKVNGVIAGRIAIAGSGTFSAGNIAAHVKGGAVSGVVTDGTGFQPATFAGSVEASGMKGTYQTFGGDSGTWGYQDSDQNPLAAME